MIVGEFGLNEIFVKYNKVETWCSDLTNARILIKITSIL